MCFNRTLQTNINLLNIIMQNKDKPTRSPLELTYHPIITLYKDKYNTKPLVQE